MIYKINSNQISELLADRIESLIAHLFPEKTIRKLGNNFRIGSKGSISICRTQKGIVWKSFEENESGNVFSLIQYALNCDFKKALSWSKSFLGISNDTVDLPKPKTENKVTPFLLEENRQKKIGYARSIWQSSSDSEDTLAEVYLRKRGIKNDIPKAIRFHPHVKNPSDRFYYPALVAAVQLNKGEISGVQIIFLDSQSGEKINKPDTVNKIFHGVIKGAAIRLSCLSERIVLTEGLEDALTILQACPDLCVWSCCGGGISSVILPRSIKEVIIAADNDKAGLANARKLEGRLRKEGRCVAITIPPKGFKDFNDFLRGVAND